jgi:hypothetical protein
LGEFIIHPSIQSKTFYTAIILNAQLILGFLGGRLIYTSDLNFHKYGLFGNVSKKFLNNTLNVNLGFRLDANSYNKSMANPFAQFSPRLALSYAFAPKWSLNFNSGLYHQLPPYTTLGYRNPQGDLVNRDRLNYMEAWHFVLGLEHYTDWNAKIGIEGFVKLYNDYPFLITDSISLANLGGDFGVIGDEPAVSNNEGRSYGVEFLYQQKLWKGFYGIASYTLFWSEFQDMDGNMIPSAWDARLIISLTGGKKFNKNWEVGLRWAVSGGNPYTPIDSAYSSIKEVWDANQEGVPDFSQANSKRLPWFHQLDIRIDKKWFFKNWAINLYLDIQNVYNFEATLPERLTVERNQNNQPIDNPNDPNRYNTFFIPDGAGQALPSIGLIVTY